MTQVNGQSPNKDKEKNPSEWAKVLTRTRSTATEGNKVGPQAEDEEGRDKPNPTATHEPKWQQTADHEVLLVLDLVLKSAIYGHSAHSSL